MYTDLHVHRSTCIPIYMYTEIYSYRTTCIPIHFNTEITIYLYTDLHVYPTQYIYFHLSDFVLDHKYTYVHKYFYQQKRVPSRFLTASDAFIKDPFNNSLDIDLALARHSTISKVLLSIPVLSSCTKCPFSSRDRMVHPDLFNQVKYEI